MAGLYRALFFFFVLAQLQVSHVNMVETKNSRGMESDKFIGPSDVGPQTRMYLRGVVEENDGQSDARMRRSTYKRRHKRPGYDPTKIDVVFLVNKLSSTSPDVFSKEQKFIRDMLGYLPVFPAKTRVACVSISERAKIEFNFNKYINKECAIKGIGKIRFTGGQFPLGHALNLIHENLIFDTGSGARNDAQKIIVVFTDGNKDNFWRVIASRLKQKGVEIIAIGLTGHARRLELTSLASEPKYAFYMDEANSLYQVIGLLDAVRECSHGQIVYDECRRRCKCVNGKLVDCFRIRKQFTEMSLFERTRYIEVVKTVSTDPAYKEKYEKFLTTHKILFNTGIHQAEYFLPWHRWFLLQYENLLREIDCGITVPFWESMEEANDALASDLWNPGVHGFGGNGTGKTNCVVDGPFKEGEWSMISSAGGGCLTRKFSGRFPDCLVVREAFLEFAKLSEFDNFERFLHHEYHDAVHCVIGGHMCTDDSASSPEFFLHHAFVDKLWQDWQNQSREHTMNEYFMSQTSKMPSNEYFSRDLLDLRQQPGCVCVEYRDPGDEVYITVKKLSEPQVKSIARVPLPAYPESAKLLFKMTERDMKQLENIRHLLQPLKVLKENELHGADRILGFRKGDIEKAVFKRSVGNEGGSNYEVTKRGYGKNDDGLGDGDDYDNEDNQFDDSDDYDDYHYDDHDDENW